MKIISKFKDYYDSAAGFGIDDTVIYVRKKQEIAMSPYIATLSIPYVDNENVFGEFRLRSEFKTFFGDPDTYYYGSYYLTGYIIGIAGQIFVCLKVANSQDQQKYKLLYSSEEFDVFFEKIEQKSIYRRNLFKPEEFFNAPLNQLKQKNLFQQHKVPVFTIAITYNKHSLLTLNDELKVYEFYKIIDPFTAFNNISGFISGVLGSKENETVKITDKDILIAKGFDKQSFKKRKETKP